MAGDQPRATLSIAEAADRLGVSYNTVARAIDRGDIAAIRLGRRRTIPTHVIDRLLTEGNTRPDGAVA